jgi:DNA-binding MarR family transcriptional regulator/GNAT superfamily N-acetyltransferase
MTDEIEAVRRFSRYYTRRIGALAEGLHGSPFPLPEARLVYEIGERGGTTAGVLARELGLDPGYLSRLVKALEDKGVVARTPNPADARQLALALTETGRDRFAAIAAAARDEVGRMLAPLEAEARSGVVEAMRRIEAVLERTAPEPAAGTAPFTLRPHRPGDMGWVVSAHGEIYTKEYGWDSRFEALVAEIVAKFLREFDPAFERCWIAERDGRRVGSVFVVKASAEDAKLRLLLVDPSARGLGLGRRLIEECIAFAREKGYRRLVLWTNDPLAAARHLYEGFGFRLVEVEKHADFGPEMIGQNWVLTL